LIFIFFQFLNGSFKTLTNQLKKNQNYQFPHAFVTSTIYPSFSLWGIMQPYQCAIVGVLSSAVPHLTNAFILFNL